MSTLIVDTIQNSSGDPIDLDVSSLNDGPLAGFRNILINGNLTINQRLADIATVAVGEYGQDRWKRTAGGMTQIIEEGNFEPSATYTLSGTGIITQQLTAPASGNWTLPDISVTARKIQLELGPVATPFERRPISIELMLCFRYLEYVDGEYGTTAVLDVGDFPRATYKPWWYQVMKRVPPTCTIVAQSGQYSNTAFIVTSRPNVVLLGWQWENTAGNFDRFKAAVVKCDAEF